ncbi:MAG: hypothetical protein ACYSTY_10835, partial [Planctomycetota bacterium]|jgi:hypothetical protein
MMIARLRGKPTPLRRYRPDFPRKLETALMKALETDPKGRYASAQEFGLALIDAADVPDADRLRQSLD